MTDPLPEPERAALDDELVERPVAGTIALMALAVRSLARRSTKSIALGGALALTVALAASVLFLTDALRGAADRVRAEAPDLVVQRLIAGRPTVLDAALADRIRDIDAVRDVHARVWGYVFVPTVQANVVVVGIAPARDAAAPPLSVVSGALSEGRAPENAGEAVLGSALARALGVAVGDRIRLPVSGEKAAPPLRVVGTFSSPAEVYTADMVLVPDGDARALLGLGPNDATDLAVSLTNPAEARIVAHTIVERIDGARVVDRDLMARVHELAFGRRGGLALAAVLPALLALLVLGWDRLSSLGREERREIAILKAVGFSTRDVVFVRLGESLVLGALATAIGMAIAYVWIFVFGAPGLRAAIAGFGVLQGETPLVPSVDMAQLFGLALGIVGPFVAVSVVPAWRAAIVDPMEGMRA
jgi:ABC-type lipoprotein release transport system permease subunit